MIKLEDLKVGDYVGCLYVNIVDIVKKINKKCGGCVIYSLLKNFRICILLYLFIFLFTAMHLWHMELTYATVTATPESHIYDLQHSLWQCLILNPLSEARD